MLDGEEILFSDFTKALENIDLETGYNPKSREFVNALNIGLMCKIVRDLSVGSNGCKIINQCNEEEKSRECNIIRGVLKDGYLFKNNYQNGITIH